MLLIRWQHKAAATQEEMIVEYIRYSIDSDRAEAFEHAYREASAALETSEHCEVDDLRADSSAVCDSTLISSPPCVS
jgi:hypothetical protein